MVACSGGMALNEISNKMSVWVGEVIDVAKGSAPRKSHAVGIFFIRCIIDHHLYISDFVFICFLTFLGCLIIQFMYVISKHYLSIVIQFSLRARVIQQTRANDTTREILPWFVFGTELYCCRCPGYL